ncbi:hypothetical protein VTJ49DRAFT_1630 [Mycothermus thermophilus]|uniref:Haloacid dehalogenase-like hydrolase n=1 Tax=Humicola insolens TaxID=85995 RepID=A0ABR3VBW3_HUMIN
MRRIWAMMQSVKPTWKFAPLSQPFVPRPGIRKLEGVVFDVDGTLCEPQNYMFTTMRQSLGIPKSVDILTHIYSLPTPQAQADAMSIIRSIEREAITHQRPQPGLRELMTYLDSRDIRKGICTRNFDVPVHSLLSKFLQGIDFSPIVTRDFRPPKPDPAGILHIARSWGLVRRAEPGEKAGVPADPEEEEKRRREDQKQEDRMKQDGDAADGPELVETHAGEEVADASGLIMVGDSLDDMTAGRRAGARTVLLVNDANRHLAEHEHTDYVIERLDELIDVLEKGLL